ncbi:pseudouridine synthase [Acanthopleuribacter pedis]|uniref:tRNA pseudouridine synthase C n=1 Tax=Acanthopleuribacter pedis TaxID=442870 RepID=A0A8J7QE69_9BACT|nr:pseudouridine synthase [Acanthopleuribacter pedis]MBO1322947.1 tRNA pseudouridine(65) synthase TruC [Acanthopleuribacter pedis]
MKLDVLYRDDHLVAVFKPSALLVHRTAMSRDRRFALQLVRNQLGCHVYPVHRLDRATSGLLIFALSSEIAGLISEQIREHQVEKGYWAFVRGFVREPGLIDRPLKNEELDQMQEAETRYAPLRHLTLPVPVHNFPEARYTLLEIWPKTGRRHQIRRHLARAGHPLIGDTMHGDGRNNRVFREHCESQRLLLESRLLSFTHPVTGEALVLKAPVGRDFQALFSRFGWDDLCDREMNGYEGPPAEM